MKEQTKKKIVIKVLTKLIEKMANENILHLGKIGRNTYCPIIKMGENFGYGSTLWRKNKKGKFEIIYNKNKKVR